MTNYATTELVVMGWLKGLNIPDISGISTSLPTDYNSWASGAFAVVEAVVGGGIEASTSQKQPVVTISFTAISLKQGNIGLNPKPNYKLASNAAESVIREVTKFSQYWRAKTPIVFPDNFETAWIQQIVPRSDVRRRPGDQGNYAVYDIDLQFFWSSEVPTI